MKVKLIPGVFGASDEVLGTIETGVDFERRVLRIYQECRSQQEIADTFAVFQAEMEQSSSPAWMTPAKVLCSFLTWMFIHARKCSLIGHSTASKDSACSSGQLQSMSSLTARFNDEDLTFNLHTSPALLPGWKTRCATNGANTAFSQSAG